MVISKYMVVHTCSKKRIIGVFSLKTRSDKDARCGLKLIQWWHVYGNISARPFSPFTQRSAIIRSIFSVFWISHIHLCIEIKILKCIGIFVEKPYEVLFFADFWHTFVSNRRFINLTRNTLP